MKKLVMIAMLTLAASFAQTSYSGIWNGKGGKEDPKYGVVPQVAQITIVQAGTSFTGTLKIGQGKVMAISTGTVSGSQLTFAVVNGNARITGNLSASGSQLSGNMTASNGEVFQFVFTKN